MDNKEKLSAFFEAENKRDWETYRRFLHPDVTWTLFSGTRRTVRGVGEYLAAMKKAYHGSDNTFVCECLHGEKCVAAILVNNLGERSCDVFEFKDGLIYREYEFIL